MRGAPLVDTPVAGSAHLAEVGAEVVLENLAHAVIVLDPSGTVVGWNGGAAERLGWSRAEMVGSEVFDLLVPEVRASARDAFARRLKGEYAQAEWPMRVRGGDPKHMVAETRTVLDDDGQVVALVVSLTDVDRLLALEESTHELSARLRQALLDSMEAVAHERQHRERLEFLGRLNDMLAETSARSEVVAGVIRLAVPRLGDWCAMYLVPDPEQPVDRQVLDVRVAARSPSGRAEGRDPDGMRSGAFDPLDHAWAAIRSSATEFLPFVDPIVGSVAEGSPGLPAPDGVDAPDRSLPVDPGQRPTPAPVARSAITVPLRKRGRVLGAVQLVRTSAERSYQEFDVALVEAASARVAASLENLRLIDQRTRIARTLQRALLPPSLPDVAGLQLAGRYVSASDGLDVGGDFYDVFETGTGALAVTVGDVCGKGAHAATVTALARDSIRMSAWHGDRPREVLEWLNRALIRMDQAISCTAAFGLIERDEAGFHLVNASCGHPLPVVVTADGAVRRPGSHGTLLGVFDEATCSEDTTDLASGDAVVLFTDGITDVPPPFDLSDDELEAMVVAAHAETVSADAMADHLLALVADRLPTRDRPDDIALLVLRVV